MDYGVEEGSFPREFIEYDFAEDALEFEVGDPPIFKLILSVSSSSKSKLVL